MDGGDIISRHSRLIPVIGVIVIIAFAFICLSPLEWSILNTQDSIEKINNDNDLNLVTASAVTEPATNSDTSNNQNTIDENNIKIVKKTIEVTQMPLKDYKAMVVYINKYKKSHKGVQPKSYLWKSKNLTISKASYTDAIKRYNKWVKTNKKRLPNYVNIFNGVQSFIEDENQFNATSTIKKSDNYPLAGELSGYEGLDKLQKYINNNLNHKAGGPHTFEGVVKAKVGDCWGLSEWTAQQLKANNYEVRIVQGASSSSSNHRWVQVKLDGKWVNFEPSLVTKTYGSKHYSTTCASVSKIVCYL